MIETLICVVILITYVLIVYKITKPVRVTVGSNENNDQNKRGNDDDDGVFFTEPELDLPPGVCLPTEPKEVVSH